MFTFSTKCEIGQFYIVAVQMMAKKCTKNMMHVKVIALPI